MDFIRLGISARHSMAQVLALKADDVLINQGDTVSGKRTYFENLKFGIETCRNVYVCIRDVNE